MSLRFINEFFSSCLQATYLRVQVTSCNVTIIQSSLWAEDHQITNQDIGFKVSSRESSKKKTLSCTPRYLLQEYRLFSIVSHPHTLSSPSSSGRLSTTTNVSKCHQTTMFVGTKSLQSPRAFSKSPWPHQVTNDHRMGHLSMPHVPIPKSCSSCHILHVNQCPYHALSSSAMPSTFSFNLFSISSTFIIPFSLMVCHKWQPFSSYSNPKVQVLDCISLCSCAFAHRYLLVNHCSSLSVSLLINNVGQYLLVNHFKFVHQHC